MVRVDGQFMFQLVDTLGMGIIVEKNGTDLSIKSGPDLSLGMFDFTLDPQLVAGYYDHALPEANMFINVAEDLSMLVIYPSGFTKKICLIDRSKVEATDDEIRMIFETTVHPEDLAEEFSPAIVATFSKPDAGFDGWVEI